MWFKKEQKRVCGGNCYGGNKDVLPEEGKSPVIVLKPQPKTFGDELREISRESQKEKNDDFDKMMGKAREEAERLFDILKKEIVKYAKKGNVAYSIYYDELNEIIKENDIGVNNPVYLKMFFREICERNKMNVMVSDYYDGSSAYVFTWGK